MDTALWANIWWLVGVVATLAISITALIVIPRHRKPTAAMAWLLLILLLPFVGILIFLLIGSVRLPSKRRAEQARIDAMIREATPVTAPTDAEEWPAHFRSIVHQNQQLASLPAVDGNRLELIEDYQG
ncbi:MAG TPA: PLDc N-terminal domain-containing protein, partial [Microbacterium sp.]|nr:PLDc N-terminal domain-containing protein [Microbacterium sp.]